jgi:outer membrane biogenesis lipoprotein LolB
VAASAAAAAEYWMNLRRLMPADADVDMALLLPGCTSTAERPPEKGDASV